MYSLYDKLALKKLGIPKYFLGIEIKSLTLGNLFLTQKKYICDFITKANMVNTNGVLTQILAIVHSTNMRPSLILIHTCIAQWLEIFNM